MTATDWKRTRVEFIRSHGFKSVSSFARACNLDPSNVWKNIAGEIRPEVGRVFLYALTLRADPAQILYLFYPENYSAVVRTINKGKV